MQNRMKSTVSKLDLFILYLFPFLTYRGYYFIGFNLTQLKLAQFILYAFLILYIGRFWFVKSKSSVFNIVRLLFLANLFSIVMAYLFWGQSISMGFRSTLGNLTLLYFFLMKYNFSENQLKRFTVFYCVQWVIIYFIALMAAPLILFGQSDLEEGVNDTRGIARFFIEGSDVIYLVFFYCINGFVEKKPRYAYASGALLIFVVIVMQVTRQTILASGLIAFLYLSRKMKHAIRPLIFLLLLLPIAYMQFQKTEIYKGMTGLTKEQQSDKTENIRVSEYRYFILDFPQPSIFTVIFGNGVPHADSAYGKSEERVRDYYKYFRSDVGYASMFAATGIVGWIIVIVLLMTIRKVKVPDEYKYIKLFLYFMFLYNIASASFYCIFLCVALYMLTKLEIQQRRQLTRDRIAI